MLLKMYDCVQYCYCHAQSMLLLWLPEHCWPLMYQSAERAALEVASEVSGCGVCHGLDGGNGCLEATSCKKTEAVG